MSVTRLILRYAGANPLLGLPQLDFDLSRSLYPTLFRGCVVNNCGFPSEAQIEKRRLRLFAFMLVLVLVAKVGKEPPSAGGRSPYTATAAAAAMNAVTAALAMDHCE